MTAEPATPTDLLATTTEQPRPPRRRGVVVIPESDVVRLVRLPPGHQIIGIRDDFARQAFLVLVEGPDMPDVPELGEAPIVGGNRWATPPPARVDVDPGKTTPVLLHALIVYQFRSARDLDPIDGSPWAALAQIVKDHKPYELSGEWWCSTCCGSCQAGEAAHWPCRDYVTAAAVVVNGLVVAHD